MRTHARLVRDALVALAAFPAMATDPAPNGRAAERHAARCWRWNPAVAAMRAETRAAEYVTAGWTADDARRQARLDWEAARLCQGDRQALGKLLTFVSLMRVPEAPEVEVTP